MLQADLISPVSCKLTPPPRGGLKEIVNKARTKGATFFFLFFFYPFFFFFKSTASSHAPSPPARWALSRSQPIAAFVLIPPSSPRAHVDTWTGNSPRHETRRRFSSGRKPARELPPVTSAAQSRCSDAGSRNNSDLGFKSLCHSVQVI